MKFKDVKYIGIFIHEDLNCNVYNDPDDGCTDILVFLFKDSNDVISWYSKYDSAQQNKLMVFEYKNVDSERVERVKKITNELIMKYVMSGNISEIKIEDIKIEDML